MQKIYQPEELRARFELRKFIESLGNITYPADAVTSGISSAELLRVFNVFHPDDATYLTPTAIEHQLLAGGFISIESEINELYLEIPLDMFKQMPKNLQSYVIPWIRKPWDVNYRKIYMGYSNIMHKRKVLVRNFLDNFCIKSSSYMASAYLHKTNNRGTMTEIYSLFVAICSTYNIADVPNRRQFYSILAEDFDLKPSQGVVKGKCGVKTLKEYLIPTTPEDIKLSIEYGIGIITSTKTDIKATNRGVFNNFNTAELVDLKDNKIRRFTGDTFKEEEEFQYFPEMEQLADRTEIEDNAQVKQTAKTGTVAKSFELSQGKENNLSNLVRSDTELQELEDTSDEIERTSGGGITSDAANTTAEVRSASDIHQCGSYDEDGDTREDTDSANTITGYVESDKDNIPSDGAAEERIEDFNAEPLDFDEFDPMAGHKDILSAPPEEEEDDEEITFDTILNICKSIPIYSTPGTLTVEALQTIMDRLNTDLKAVDIYDDIISAM